MRQCHDRELATRLALGWLRRYPNLPAESERPLIDRVLRSPMRDELGPIAEARCRMNLDDARRRDWDAVAFVICPDVAAARFGDTVEPDLLWHLRDRTHGRDGEERPRVALEPREVRWVLTAFRRLWPSCGFPSGTFYGDTNPWDAASYLAGLVSRLGEDTSNEAIAAMATLVDLPSDGYSDHIKTVAAEQRRKRAEQAYDPPGLAQISAALNDAQPVDAADLMAVMLENLRVAQDQVHGSDVDWYRGFFCEDGHHEGEEACRDEMIKLLRTIDDRFEYVPESHGADDKRVDIVVRAGPSLILPIEIKGEWHRDLWTAADAQLDHLYVNDWRAERGVYLVLWFGGASVRGGRGAPPTPDALRERLHGTSNGAQAGRIEVVVFDLTRPIAA
jgi:hypothetical protein